MLKITLNLYYGAKIHNGSFFLRLATTSNADTMFIKTRREFTNVCTFSDLLAFVQESMLKLTLPISYDPNMHLLMFPCLETTVINNIDYHLLLELGKDWSTSQDQAVAICVVDKVH